MRIKRLMKIISVSKIKLNWRIMYNVCVCIHIHT